jgi:uncharacterized protein
MIRQVLVDTGPLVAFIDRRDELHQWANSTLRNFQYPLITCEPVVTEACFLLASTYGGQTGVMALINDGALQVDFSLNDNASALNALISKYDSVPMSLADACLVRMTELKKGSSIVTFDSDFRVYRMNRNQVIPMIMP